MTIKPAPYQYPQERTESTGGGADFPGSAGDRERGKFRPSSIPRRTAVAVVGDDGQPIARTTDQILEEILLYQKAILQALSLTALGESFEPDDVLGQV